MTNRRNAIKAILALGDYAIMVGSLAVMLVVRYGEGGLARTFVPHIRIFWVIFATWIVVFYVFEVYNIAAPFNHRKFLIAMLVSVGLSIAILYAFDRFVEVAPRRNLLITVALFVPMFYAWRVVALRVVDRMGPIRSIAIIGSDEHAIQLVRHIHEQRRQGYRVVGMVCDPQNPLPEDLLASGIVEFATLPELLGRIQDLGVAVLVVGDTWYNALYAELYELIPMRVRFYQLTTFWEELLEAIPIYSARESWFLENFNRGTSRGYMMLKRGVDLLAVLVFGPVFAVAAAATALAVKVSSKGPAIFSQTRVGQNGRDFTVYKFRSMYVDAEKHGAQWATENDPRVTPVGRFIRATRLDEIPQVWNVLRGDMSLIGPRPERPVFVEDLAEQIPHYRLRHLVRPGLTGWAQVKYRYGSSVEDAAVKLTYDIYYVKNISMVLDIKITLKTILTIVSRQGQ